MQSFFFFCKEPWFKIITFILKEMFRLRKKKPHTHTHTNSGTFKFNYRVRELSTKPSGVGVWLRFPNHQYIQKTFPKCLNTMIEFIVLIENKQTKNNLYNPWLSIYREISIRIFIKKKKIQTRRKKHTQKKEKQPKERKRNPPL